MKKIKVFAFMMIIIISSFVSVNVAAADEITPLWSNISSVTCKVTFNGTTGTVCCDITGQPGASAVRGTLVLYKGSTELKSWDLASNTGSKTILYGFTGISGITYKIELNAEVYKDGYWESISREDSTMCP